MDMYEGEIYEIPEFIPDDDEDRAGEDMESLPDINYYDPEDDGLVYDLRTHAYVYDSHGDRHEAEPILRPAITWGEVEPLAVWKLELLGAFDNIPKAPWERPEDYSPAMHEFSASERGEFAMHVFAFPPSEIPEFAYRVDVRFSNGVAAVISFPTIEARDTFLDGEEIENYRIEGEDLCHPITHRSNTPP